MTIANIVSLARKNSNTNSSTFSDADMLLYLKAIMPLYQADIEKVNEGYMGSIEHRDLKATGNGIWTDSGTDYLTREYNLPADMVDRLDHVYAKLDGINWIPLKEYDRTDRAVPFKEDNITSRYSNDEGVAGYYTFRRSLFILSGEIEDDVTDGLEIWTYGFPSLASLTVGSSDEGEVYGIPESMQKLLAIDLSIEWKSNRDKPLPLSKTELQRDDLYKDRLAKLKGLNRSKVISYERPSDGYGNGFNL